MLTYTSTSFAQQSLAPYVYSTPLYKSVTVNNGIPFKNTFDKSGNPITLLMDVYEPCIKINYKRPLLIFIHGGGMVGGFRNDDQALRICNEFSMRGYVCASIDYRIGVDTPGTEIEYETAVYKAVQDARSSISFLKQHADDFCIDTSMISISGTSAGSVVALYSSYWDQSEVPSYINTSQFGLLNDNINFRNTDIKSCVNNWGAVSDTTIFMNENIPLINIANTGDPVIPFEIGLYNNTFYLYGSSVINRVAKRLNISSSLYSFNLNNHGINPNTPREDTVIWLMSAFLYSNLSNKLADKVCNELDLSLYPNPTDHLIQIRNNSTLLSYNGQIEIFNLMGSRVDFENLILNPMEKKQIDISRLSNGIYFAEIISAQKVTSLKFVVQRQ